MKNFLKGFLCFGAVLIMVCFLSLRADAKENNTVLPGIYIESISLEGKTKEEAQKMVEDYVNKLLAKSISLVAVDGNAVSVTPADMGYRVTNPDIVDEAVQYGKTGNVVQRYKIQKDLQHENKIYVLTFDADKDLIRQIIVEQCASFNKEAKDATLIRTNGSFTVQPGQSGMIVDTEASINVIYDFVTKGWNKEDGSVSLSVITDEPQGTEEELLKVKDVLGTFTTSFSTSNSSRSANVRNGCALINSTTLYPGEEFSTYDAVAPFSEANGYYMAGSYLNGQVVDSLGGGICQVSTTLYNAVLLSELEVTERHNHSMIVTYVNPSADAAIAESSGKDFRFVNNTGAPVYIEGVASDDKQITFTIYGLEYRDSTRQIKYESEVISKTYPDSEAITADAGQPVGSIQVQSAHVGCKANLWKVVTENGVEVSRDKINSSSYQMAPRSAVVGIATEDPNAYNEIMAAISTNNIDHIKNVAAALKAAAAQPAPPAEGTPAEAPAAPPAAPPAEAPAEVPAG